MRTVITAGIGLAASALLTGCSAIGDLRSTVEGMTNRFVMEAMYFGVDVPDDPQLADAIAQSSFAGGARVTALLADAAEVSDLDNAPISGTAVSFISGAAGGMSMQEVESGRYEIPGSEGLRYVSHQDVAISSSYSGLNREITVQAPPAPELDLPEWQPAGQALSVDLRGQDFDSALVTVIDVQTGELGYSNAPETPQEFYNLGHGDGGELLVAIPGSALKAEGLYVIGVAGLGFADTERFVEVNTALSTFVAGQYGFAMLCTFADPVFCDPPDTGVAY